MSWAEALIGALGGGAKSMGDQLKAEQELEDRRTLMREQAELDAVKTQKAEQARLQAAQQARQQMTRDIDARMPGLVDSAALPAARKQTAPQFAGARPANPTTWTPEQQASVDQARELAARDAAADPALRDKLSQDPTLRARAAVDAGYIDQAAKLQDMGKNKLTQVGYGSMLVDQDNNVVVDNSQGRAAERMAAIEKKGEPKPFDIAAQAKLAKDIDDVLKGAGMGQEALPTSLAPLGADGKPVADTAFNMNLRKIVAGATEQARLQGDNVSVTQIMGNAERKLKMVRDSSLAEAVRARDSLFGADGRTKVTPEVAEKVRAMYGAQVPLTSPEEFAQYVYGWSFNKQVQGPSSTPARAPAKQADPAPPKESPKRVEQEVSAGKKAPEENTSVGGLLKAAGTLVKDRVKKSAEDDVKRRKQLWDQEAQARSDNTYQD